MLKCYLKGKTCRKLANELNFYEKDIDSRGHSDPALGLYIYFHSSQTSLLVSQVSEERLQDHWSSVFFVVFFFYITQILYICREVRDFLRTDWHFYCLFTGSAESAKFHGTHAF